MTPGVSLLLGLGLFLDQRIQAQEGASIQSSIWAVPGPLVALQGSVTIICRIPPGVTKCHLYHEESREVWPERDPGGAPGVVQFSLQEVTPVHAGRYHCDYWTGGSWSGHSDTLELDVTGGYKDKPSLTAQPGPQVASGGQVTLLCHTPLSYDVFTLCRDPAASLQDCPQQGHSSFLMPPVSLAHGGTYRCYGSISHSPHLWSLPSDPLELLVTASITSLAPSVPPSDPPPSQFCDHHPATPRSPVTGDLAGPPRTLVVGVSAAAALLLCLLLLLLLLCLCRGRWSRRRARRRDTGGGTKGPVRDASPAVDVQGEDEDDTQPREDGQMDTQVAAAEDPQEVTYAHLHLGTLTTREGPHLSPALQDASSQPCVYASLTSP